MLSEGDAIRSMISLRLGVVPLAERFPFPGIADPKLYRELYDEVRRRLGLELPGSDSLGPRRAPDRDGRNGDGAGGARPGPPPLRSDRVQGHVLSRATVERLLGRLCGLSVGERAELPCLEPGRADLIIPGRRS